MTEEELFEAAIDRPGDQRQAFLRQACGSDGALRARVEALLAAHEQPDSLFQQPPLEPLAASSHRVPHRLGDFEILRPIGRGGMGVVYEARQRSLNRRVALKVLSSGLGLTSKAILRFRREAEAAARLHHTNIVPIYATGDEHGVPYYAMELVDGPSLDRVIQHLRRPIDVKNGVTNASPSSSGSADGEYLESPEFPAWVKDTIACDAPADATADVPPG